MSIQAQPHPLLLLASWLVRSIPTVCIVFAAGFASGYPQGLIQQPTVLQCTPAVYRVTPHEASARAAWVPPQFSMATHKPARRDGRNWCGSSFK
jgi:hypothetical protein